MALLTARTALKLKPLVIATLLVPMLIVLWHWVSLVRTGLAPALTSNPVEYTIRDLGEWALRFLILGLAITPLVRLTKTPALTAWRRIIGVTAFSYVVVHLMVYLVIDLELSLAALWADVVKRTYITFGMAAFLLLIPLAVTSTNGWLKRLGAKNWRRLHKAAYATALLGGVHFLFMVKGNQPEPKIYLAIIVLLLLARLVPKKAMAVAR
jgi:methionine sulfoxide reductase heme-binding subunit